MAAPTTMILSVGAAFAVGSALTAALILPSVKTGADATIGSRVKLVTETSDPAAHVAPVQKPVRSWSEPAKPRGSELQELVLNEQKTLSPDRPSSAPSLVFNDTDSREAGEKGRTTLAERSKASKSSELPAVEPSLLPNVTRVKPASIPVVRSRGVVTNVDRSRSEPAERVRGEFVSGDRTAPFRKPPVVSLPVQPSKRRYEEHPNAGYRTASYPSRGYGYADADSSAEVGAPYRSQRSMRAEGEPLITRKVSAQTGVMRWLQEPVER